MVVRLPRTTMRPNSSQVRPRPSLGSAGRRDIENLRRVGEFGDDGDGDQEPQDRADALGRRDRFVPGQRRARDADRAGNGGNQPCGREPSPGGHYTNPRWPLRLFGVGTLRACPTHDPFITYGVGMPHRRVRLIADGPVSATGVRGDPHRTPRARRRSRRRCSPRPPKPRPRIRRLRDARTAARREHRRPVSDDRSARLDGSRPGHAHRPSRRLVTACSTRSPTSRRSSRRATRSMSRRTLAARRSTAPTCGRRCIRR